MGLRVNNVSSDAPSVYLYGVIGDDYGGITSAQFRKELAEIPPRKPINLHIHSEGGSVFEGIAMFNQLRQRIGKISVVVDGLAASAASFVAMAGSTITMAQHSWMMIHEAHGIKEGRASDFRAAADQIDAMNSEIVSIYAPRWKGTEAELRAAMDAETWLDAEAAVKVGLADAVGESLSIAACVSPEVNAKLKFKCVPESLQSGEKSPRLKSMLAKLPPEPEKQEQVA